MINTEFRESISWYSNVDLILSSSVGNHSEEQMARAQSVRVKNKLVLRFCGLKELRHILTVEYELPVNRNDELE